MDDAGDATGRGVGPEITVRALFKCVGTAVRTPNRSLWLYGPLDGGDDQWSSAGVPDNAVTDAKVCERDKGLTVLPVGSLIRVRARACLCRIRLRWLPRAVYDGGCALTLYDSLTDVGTPTVWKTRLVTTGTAKGAEAVRPLLVSPEGGDTGTPMSATVGMVPLYASGDGPFSMLLDVLGPPAAFRVAGHGYAPLLRTPRWPDTAKFARIVVAEAVQPLGS